MANQVFYEVYVSSGTRFNHFEYDHVTYKYVASRTKEGVVEAKNTSGVRVTDLERTVIDSIRDFNKIGGFEELLNCLEGIHYLDEKKMKRYLDMYDTQGLYQRVGYLLDHYKSGMQISKEFIDYCKNKIGKSRRYLVSEAIEDSYLFFKPNIRSNNGIRSECWVYFLHNKIICYIIKITQHKERKSKMIPMLGSEMEMNYNE